MGDNAIRHTIRDILTYSSGITQILREPPFILGRSKFGIYRYHLEILGPEIGIKAHSARVDSRRLGPQQPNGYQQGQALGDLLVGAC